MLTKFLLKQSQEKKLTARLEMLKKRRESLGGQLAQTKRGNQGNARRSDRKFKENRGKALSARAKRANKSALLDIDKQIKFTELKLRQLADAQKNKKS